MVKSIFVSLISITLLFGNEKLDELKERLSPLKDATVVLTHMRSGTNWTICSLMYLTQRRFADLSHYPCPEISSGWNRLRVRLDPSKPYIYRTHSPERAGCVDRDANKLIMSLRNYKELFFRGRTFENATVGRFRKEMSTFIKSYLSYLKEFEKWPELNRYLFTYEELIHDPQKLFSSMLLFMDEPMTRMEEYMGNIQELKDIVLRAYTFKHKGKGGSVTQGNYAVYHSSKVRSELVEELDYYMRQEAGEKLWQKYLSQYCTNL